MGYDRVTSPARKKRRIISDLLQQLGQTWKRYEYRYYIKKLCNHLKFTYYRWLVRGKRRQTYELMLQTTNICIEKEEGKKKKQNGTDTKFYREQAMTCILATNEQWDMYSSKGQALKCILKKNEQPAPLSTATKTKRCNKNDFISCANRELRTPFVTKIISSAPKLKRGRTHTRRSVYAFVD